MLRSLLREARERGVVLREDRRADGVGIGPFL
jgi:hypothetical protein